MAYLRLSAGPEYFPLPCPLCPQGLLPLLLRTPKERTAGRQLPWPPQRFYLNINGHYRNRTDDDVHASERVFDGLVIGIVDLGHLDIVLNCSVGALAGKEDDVLDDTGSLILQELLNNVVSDGSNAKDGEFVYPDMS